MANLRHKTIYEFEKFRLDAGHLMLYQNEREISLAPKVIETLLALVERCGEVLSKDELMELVWADSIVEEGNLSQNLYLLRKTLGEGKNGKPFIETFRRRGYRFNGEVKILESQIAAKNSENVLEFAPHVAAVGGQSIKETRHGQVVALAQWQPHEDDGKTTSAPLQDDRVSDTVPIISTHSWLSNRKLIAACAVLAVLAGGIAVWKIANQNRNQASSDMLASLRIRSLISWDAEAGEGDSGARFSPSGTMIAYSRTKDGQRNIWTKQIPDGNPNLLTNGNGSYFNPIWSPDSQRIAFVSNRDNQIGIWMTPFSGGELTLIKTIESGINLLQWSKNGATIYYSQGFNLFALNIASKQINQLTNFDSTDQAQFFNISPNEDRVAYASGANERLHIFVMTLNGGDEPEQVTNNEAASDEYPFWLPDGEHIIYSSKRDGVFQICIVYLNEHKSLRMNIDTSDRLINDVASGGDKILFSHSREEGDLWKVDLAEKKENQITSKPGLELWADASPDGKSIVLQTVTESKHMLGGSIDTYSSDDKQPVNIASNGFSPTFSPDGRKIAFLRHAGNLQNIWVIEGDTEKQLTTGGIWFASFSLVPYNRLQVKDYSWSPDGNSLIYCAKDDDLWNVWKVAADGLGQPQQISTNTDKSLIFSGPLVSPDGEQIAFVSSPQKAQADANQMNSVHVLNEQRSEIIFSDKSVIRLIGWTQPDGNLIVAETDGKPAKPGIVKLVQISAGAVSTDLASIDAAYFYNIRLSPDGRQIAYAAREDGKDNIRVISISNDVTVKMTSNIDPNIYVSGITWSPDSKAIYYSTQKNVVLISMIENFK